MTNVKLIHKVTAEEIEINNVIEIKVTTHKDAVQNGYSKNTLFYTFIKEEGNKHSTVTLPLKEYYLTA